MAHKLAVGLRSAFRYVGMKPGDEGRANDPAATATSGRVGHFFTEKWDGS
jgi:hypothetical protein